MREIWEREYHLLRSRHLDICLMILGAIFVAGSCGLALGVLSEGDDGQTDQVIAFASLWAGVWCFVYGFVGALYLCLMDRVLQIKESRMSADSRRDSRNGKYNVMTMWIVRLQYSRWWIVAARVIMLLAFVVGVFLWWRGYPEYVTLNVAFTLLIIAASLYVVGEALKFGKILIERIEELGAP